MGSGSILCRFKTRCGATLHLPAHGYHMPKADIRLESPQSIIKTMGDSGRVVVNGWNVKWHLPDKRIIDVEVDQCTNLPLIHDFVCTSAEKKKFGARYINNAVAAKGLCKKDEEPDHLISMKSRKLFSVALL